MIDKPTYEELEETIKQLTAEDKRQRSEDRYRSILEAMTDAVYICSPDFRIEYMNPKMLDRIGYDATGELCHKAINDLNDKCPFCVSAKVQQGQALQTEIVSPKDRRSYLVSHSPIHNVDATISTMAIYRDITILKNTEAALRGSEEKYRSLFENGTDLLWIHDLKGNLIETNLAFKKEYGWSEDDFTNLNVRDLIPDRYRNQFEVILNRLIENGKDEGHLRVVTKDGRERVIEYVNSLIYDQGVPVAVRGSGRDVTDRLKAEKALKESERRYRTILEDIEEGYFEVDLTGNYIFVNEAMCQIRGQSKAELIGMNNRDFMTKETAQKVFKVFNQVYNSGKPVKTTDWETIHKDGAKRHMEVSVSLIKDAKDQPCGFRGLVRDVTQKKQDEAELISTKNFLQNILNSSIDGITTTDLHGKVTYCTPKLQDMTGYEPKEIIGKKIATFYGNGIQDAKKVMTMLKEKGELTNYETKFRKKDGALIDVFLSASLLRIQNGEITGTLGIFKDITDKKRLEEDLLQAQKLESVGVLAGGIAHDFNNLLTVILGNISLAKGDLTKGDILEFLSEAEKASLKAKGLTHQLITFSKGGAPVKKTASLIEFTKNSVNFALSGSNVRCEFSLPDDLWRVEYDENQMEHAINGLINNAVEAMPEGGIIKIFAENIMIKEEEGQSLNLQKSKYVKISIRDQGSGISEEILPRIFDPYFSTKDRGNQKGMGLGLTTVYSIISRHKGHINVDSEKDAGATFHIYLPAISAEGKAQRAERDLGSPSTTVKPQSTIIDHQSTVKRVLVMDDEESLRNLVKLMLIRFGYEVGLARDGAEAIALYKEALMTGQRFDAVILDLTIKGGMGGEQAIKELIKIDPDVKAIISSGYFNDPVMANFRDYGFRRAMPKPYTTDTLGKALGEVLNLTRQSRNQIVD